MSIKLNISIEFEHDGVDRRYESTRVIDTSPTRLRTGSWALFERKCKQELGIVLETMRMNLPKEE